jgi:tetratricopeptide (TPR) repeat protein
LGLLLASGVARAEDEAAKKASLTLLKQGNERLDKEKFQQALEKFEQAYEHFPSPRILFSEGQALRGLNRNADALRAFQRFLDEAKDAGEEHRKEAQANVSELSALVNQELAKQSAHPAPSDSPADGSVAPLKLLFIQGLALRGLGRNVEAMASFERFLDDAKDASAQDRKEAQTNIDNLTPWVGRVKIGCNRSEAAVTIDGQTLAPASLPRSIWVEPGSHEVALEWEGEKKSAPFTASAGQSVSLGLDFEEKKALSQALSPPVPAPAISPVVIAVQPSSPAPRSWYRSTWVWIASGAVVAIVGTGLFLLYGTSQRYPNPGFGTQGVGGQP